MYKVKISQANTTFTLVFILFMIANILMFFTGILSSIIPLIVLYWLLYLASNILVDPFREVSKVGYFSMYASIGISTLLIIIQLFKIIYS